MNTKLLASVALCVAMPFGTAMAQPSGHQHPYYLHCLTDLRSARWLLENRPGDAAIRSHEDLAIQEIDATYMDLKRAAIDDGKDVHFHPARDAELNHPGRLHQAAQLLQKIRSDVNRDEDDPKAVGLQQRALHHIDSALNQVEAAITDVNKHR